LILEVWLATGNFLLRARLVLVRHVASDCRNDDQLDPRLTPETREFRAKLSEVAFSEQPKLVVSSIIHPNIGDATPHGQANARVMLGLLRWMHAHAREIKGLDVRRPLLPQLPLLTDSQLRAAFRSMDPLAGA